MTLFSLEQRVKGRVGAVSEIWIHMELLFLECTLYLSVPKSAMNSFEKF